MKRNGKFKYVKYIDIELNEIHRTILDRPVSEFTECILITAVQLNLKPNKMQDFKRIRNYIIFASMNN